MNQQTLDTIRKLSKTMRGITIITATQLSRQRTATVTVPVYKGPIVMDYMNLLTK